MSKYIVKTPLKTGGQIRTAGEAVELNDETAAGLVQDGVVEAADGSEKKEQTGETTSEESSAEQSNESEESSAEQSNESEESSGNEEKAEDDPSANL